MSALAILAVLALAAPAPAQVLPVPKFRTGVVSVLSTRAQIGDWMVYRAAGLAVTPAGAAMEPSHIDELVKHGELVHEANDGAAVVAVADGKSVGFVPASRPERPFAVIASAADPAFGTMGRVASEKLGAIHERIAVGDAEGALVKLRELFGL